MIAIYEDNGRIFNIIFDPVPEHFLPFYKEQNDNVIEFESDGSGADIVNTKYVLDGVLTERPFIEGEDSVISADGEDTATYTFPNGATVKIDGEEYVLDDGRLEFSTDEPGVYSIEFDTWPYVPFKATVTAAEAGA